MPQQKFILWILILTVGLMQWFFTVSKHFGGEAQLKVKVGTLKERLEQEQLRHALAEQRLSDLKQSVAALIPDLEIEEQESYQIRNLASIVVAPDLEKFKIERASSMFERAKSNFTSGDYEKSNQLFSQLINTYPDSIHVVESYFLYSEGKYLEGELEECLKTIDTMVTLFPENDLVGFSLLRMGQILSSRDRVEDAEQIFRTIKQNFRNPALNDQADKLLREIVL
jgi:TolA-binding protein